MNNKNHDSKFLFYVASFAGLALGVDNGSLQFVLLKIANQFDMNEAEMGSLVTIQFMALTISALITGVFADRIGKKKTAVFSAFTFTVSSLLCFSAISKLIVMIGIFGCGASFGSLECSICAALSDKYGKRSGRYLLIMQGALGLGSVFGPQAADLAMRIWHLSWTFAFLLCAVLFGITLILIILSDFTPSEDQIINTEETNANDDNGKFTFKSLMLSGLLFCGLIYGGLETGIGSFIDTFYVTILENNNYSAITLSLFWAAIGTARLAAGVMYNLRRYILFCSFAGAAVLYFTISFMTVPFIAMIVIILIGTFIGPVLPVLVSIINEKCPKSTGLTTSLMNAASGIGSSVAPPIVGAVSETLVLTIAFRMLALLALTGAVIYRLFVYKKI